MNEGLDRRGFLALTGAALAGLALVACGSPRAAGPNVDIGALRDLISGRDGIEQIGKYAVKARGIGNRPRDVAAALAPNASARWVGTAPRAAMRDHLRVQVADDFAENRIVSVAGWQLPLTEARIAALVYLSG